MLKTKKTTTTTTTKTKTTTTADTTNAIMTARKNTKTKANEYKMALPRESNMAGSPSPNQGAQK